MPLVSRRLPLLLLALIIVVAGCSNPDGSTPDVATTEPPRRSLPDIALVYATLGEPATLNPLFITDTASAVVSGLIFEGLVKLNNRMDWQPALASDWEVDAGGTQWTFTLRKGVKWHDGEPFTAADVAFTFEALKHDRYHGKWFPDVAAITAVEVVDEHQITLRTDGPYAPFLNVAAIGILPGHRFGWDPEQALADDQDTVPVGTGPFKFGPRRQGQQLELLANLDYWDGSPQIGRLILRVVPGHPGIVPAFVESGVDVGAVDPSEIEAVRRLGSFNIFEYPSYSYSFIAYNLNDPLFADRRVRLALAHAIDREQILAQALFGRGVLVDSHGVPTRWDYDRQLPQIDFDPQRAQQLLAQAGWSTGADGSLTKDGRRFEFSLHVHAEDRAHWETALLIQEQLRQVGIEVRINWLDWQQFSSNLLDKQFAAALATWRLGPDPDSYDVWHSNGPLNFVSYDNPEVDRLLELGRRQLRRTDRRRTYVTLQRILAADQPYTFLYSANELAGVHRRFTGPIAGTPAGLLWNVADWELSDDSGVDGGSSGGD